MKNTISLILFLLTIQVVCGQQKGIDSLKNIINKQRRDTTEMKAIIKLANIYYSQNQLDSQILYIHRSLSLASNLNYSSQRDSSGVLWMLEVAFMYRFSNPDSSIIFAREALFLARQLSYKRGEGQALIILGENFRLAGDFPRALGNLFNALRVSKDIKDQELEENSLDFIGIALIELGEYRQGLNYLYQAKKIEAKLPLRMTSFSLSYIGQAYEKLNMLDSALFFQDSALFFQQQGQALNQDVPRSPLRSTILTRLGVIQDRLGNQTQALSYYRDVIHTGDLLNLGTAQYLIAELFYTLNQPDSSLHYAQLAFINSQKSLQKTWVLEASELLAKLYKTKNKLDSAFHYQEVSTALKDSLFGPEKFHKLQLLAINEQQQQQENIQRQKEIQQEKEKFENKIKMFSLLAIAAVFLLLALILYRNNQQKQKANKVLEGTLTNLRATQAQLIQSEKMASLGELTAGIAHEIQNPLNFVNNFSEVNTELIDEAEQEIINGNISEVKTILNDIKDNEQKIIHHGKRADAIVKGMLQHSRVSTGQKELTDINALADEYLRLSYHGLRAKDKSFNATLQTDFDNGIEKINIVRQDIGRVLLNLYNNAFYTVTEKKKQVGDNYERTVSVNTKKINGKVEIKVKDNGNGIPQKVVDKIFQPFFTTKPTGQGTGLGLSLSYDIIKAHGGEIKVKTKEGEGSEFIFQLPV